jgi:xanthine permease XanP
LADVLDMLGIRLASRLIAIPAGWFAIALAFCPKLAAAFSIMPVPVMSAVLVYVAAFTIVGGLQVITSCTLDVHRTFVAGIALILGLSVEIVRGSIANCPACSVTFRYACLTRG